MRLYVESCEQFLNFLKVERNLSLCTIKTYTQNLKQFGLFLSEYGICELKNISTKIITTFIAKLRKEGLKPSSVNNFLSTIKSFFKFLISRNVLTEDPTLVIQCLKNKKRIPSYFKIDEMAFLLDQSAEENILEKEERSNFISLRDKAIIEVFYSCGIRASELVGLNLNQCDLDDKTVRVLGKGNKERIVPIGIPAINAILQYLPFRNKYANKDEKSLFISERGTRITYRSVSYRLNVYAKTHNFNVHIHPHKLRHTFATHILKNSGELRAIQELLGHNQLSTTQIYTHADISSLVQIYDKTHPRDKMRKKEKSKEQK